MVLARASRLADCLRRFACSVLADGSLVISGTGALTGSGVLAGSGACTGAGGTTGLEERLESRAGTGDVWRVSCPDGWTVSGTLAGP